MPLSVRTVRRHRKCAGRWRKARDIRIEDQEHLVSAAIKDVTISNGTEWLQPKNTAIEVFDRHKIVSVKNRFENAKRRDGCFQIDAHRNSPRLSAPSALLTP